MRGKKKKHNRYKKFKNVISFERYENIPKRNFTFTLGGIYLIHWHENIRCQFIKTTPKGFKLLNLTTSRCITSYLYDKEYVGTHIPRDETEFTVKIPNWIWKITKEEQTDCG